MAWKSEEEFHQSLGQFCADFELVCHSMEVCIRAILHKNGLVNSDIQEILLSGSTAEPLAKLLQSLTNQTLPMDDNKRAIFNKVFKKIRDLTEHRNSLIHAKWFTYGKGLPEEEEEVVSVGQRLYANKQGASTQQIVVDQDKLNELLKECRDGAIMVSLLTRCVQDIRTPEDCFAVVDGELVIKYEALRPIKVSA
jgi:hypothetical protein